MNKPVELSQIVIKEFPQDERIWCLSWFGYFDKHENSSSEKIIKVALVPLVKGVNHDYLNKVVAYETDLKKEFSVNIGLLPALKLGSFWEKGKLKDFGNKFSELSLDLTVDDQSSYIVDKTEENELFKDSNYPYIKIKNFENSRLLVIKCFQEIGKAVVEKIIIPCVEVLRFYYASSSQLTRILIGGQLNEKKNEAYNKEKSYFSNGIAHIHLNKNIPDSDAPHLARLAFDKYAESQAINIYDTGVRNLEEIGNFFIEAKPPFQGKTTLKMEGKFVKSSSEAKDNCWNFLVFQIKSCSYRFPFSELTFGRDNDGRLLEDEENKPEALPGNAKINIKTVKHTTEVNISNKSQPSANFNLRDLVLAENNFPDLVGKKISKIEKEKNHNKTAQTQFTSSENNGDFSIGAETYGKTELKPIAAVRDIPKGQEENTPKRQGALAADFSNFTKVISELSTFEGINHCYIKLKFDSDVPDEEGCSFFPLSINKWAYINLQEGRQRQFMTVEISYIDHFFYFFESEKLKHESYSMFAIHGSNFANFSENVLKQVIRKCIENYGRWLNDKDLEDIYRRRFKHTANSIENCAKKFYRYMKYQIEEIGNIQQKLSTNTLEEKSKDYTESSDGKNADEVA